MKRAMSELLVKNLAAVGAVACGVMCGVSALAAAFMMIGMLAGNWALLHVMAMLGIAAGFAALTACCMAVCEYHGCTFWRSEHEE